MRKDGIFPVFCYSIKEVLLDLLNLDFFKLNTRYSRQEYAIVWVLITLLMNVLFLINKYLVLNNFMYIACLIGFIFFILSIIKRFNDFECPYSVLIIFILGLIILMYFKLYMFSLFLFLSFNLFLVIKTGNKSGNKYGNIRINRGIYNYIFVFCFFVVLIIIVSSIRILF